MTYRRSVDMSLGILRGLRKREPRFSKNPKIPSTVIDGMGAEGPEGHQWFFFHEIKVRNPDKRR